MVGFFYESTPKTGTIIGVNKHEDYPKTESDYHRFFPTDESCTAYLSWLRFDKSGYKCPRCTNEHWWRQSNGYGMCTACRLRLSPTAQTIFARTQLPLSVWFKAAWLFTGQKNGVSAKGLQRSLGIHSYQSAWTILHKLRTATVDPNRKKLSGRVEVDETFVGGVAPGCPGRTPGGKNVVIIAVEMLENNHMGRIRMGLIPNASQEHLLAFFHANVEMGSTLITDAWKGYGAQVKAQYKHEPVSVQKSDLEAHQLLPGVHRVASLFKRWLLGTLQGSVSQEKLPAYFDEFVFRFNRRTSKDTGLLFYRLMCLAVRTQPTTFSQLVSDSKPKKEKPTPPTCRELTPTLVPPAAQHYPWEC